MKDYPEVNNLAELVAWLAKEYHGGSVLPIASRLKVSPALVGFWSRGQTREPKVQNLRRLAKVYKLNFQWVLRVVYGPPPIGGGAAGPAAPHVLQVLENIGNSVSYRTLVRWLRAILVPALLPTPCAA